MNISKAIRELEKIEMVRQNNGRYRLDNATTKKQMIILSSFGLADTDVIQSAVKISRLLADNKSLLSNTDEGDDSFESEEDDFYGENEIDIYG